MDDTRKNATSSTKTMKTVLNEKGTTQRESTASIRHPQFSNNFEFVEIRKDEFFCPICKDVLGIPIETVCSHYSCADCLFQVIEFADGPPSCPMCKLHLTSQSDLRCAPRVFIQLLCQLDGRCKRCNQELKYENSLNHACDATPPAVNPAPARTQVAPPQNRQSAAPAPQRTLEDAFTELRQGRLSQDVVRLSTVAVKLLMKESDDGGTARLAGPGKVCDWKLSLQSTLHLHCMSNSVVLLFLGKSFYWKNSGFILLFVFFFDIANYNATYCSS